MKNLLNYLNAQSCIYKSTTKGAVILTNIVCSLFLLGAALVENHPLVALSIMALIGAGVYLMKTTPDRTSEEKN